MHKITLRQPRTPNPPSHFLQLLEYNNIEGMILLSELSRRRIRSINKLIRVGKNEVVMVIRVDKEKGYIDLSKRRVSPEDVQKTEDRFNKAKAVHSILRHISNRLQTPMASLYKRIAWPLSRKYGHAYDAFQMAVAEPDPIFKDLDVTVEERREAIEYIKQKMTPQPLKIRADIQVTCFKYDGVNAIREGLMAAQAMSTEAVPIRVQLIAAPLYVMQTTTLNKEAGMAALNAAIDACKTAIEAKGGQLVVKLAPQVTTSQEENELARMLEGLEADEDGSEGEGEEGEEDNEEGMGGGDLSSGGMDFDSTPSVSKGSNAAAGAGSSAAAAAPRAAPAPAPAPEPVAASGSGADASLGDVGGDDGGAAEFAKKKKKTKKVAVAAEED